MCGRFNIVDDAAMRALLDSLNLTTRLATQVNIAPTETVPVVVREPAGHQIHVMRWWLTPSWAPEISNQYSMFNARAESLEKSRAFRGPYRHHRGIIPASSFLEWRQSEHGGKQPYLVRPETGCFVFAALWDVWQKQGSYLESCTIVTTQAVAGLRWLHDRMPLLLDAQDINPWLDPSTDLATIDRIRTKVSSANFCAYPVSSDLNNSRHKLFELLEPIDDPIEIKH